VYDCFVKCVSVRLWDVMYFEGAAYL